MYGGIWSIAWHAALSKSVWHRQTRWARARVPAAPSVPSGNIGLKFVDSVIRKQKWQRPPRKCFDSYASDIIRSDVRPAKSCVQSTGQWWRVRAPHLRRVNRFCARIAPRSISLPPPPPHSHLYFILQHWLNYRKLCWNHYHLQWYTPCECCHSAQSIRSAWYWHWLECWQWQRVNDANRTNARNAKHTISTSIIASDTHLQAIEHTRRYLSTDANTNSARAPMQMTDGTMASPIFGPIRHIFQSPFSILVHSN